MSWEVLEQERCDGCGHPRVTFAKRSDGATLRCCGSGSWTAHEPPPRGFRMFKDHWLGSFEEACAHVDEESPPENPQKWCP